MSKKAKQHRQVKTSTPGMKSLRTEQKEVPQNVIYVGRIPSKFTENTLKKFVSQFGVTKNLIISRSPSTGGSRGYAFVEFEDAEAAANAVSELNGCFLQGKSLVARMHSDVNPNTFIRPDQRRRIRCDTTRRLNGYISPPTKVRRCTREDAMNTLNKLVQLEARVNEKNKAAGINYVFNGFAAQGSIL